MYIFVSDVCSITEKAAQQEPRWVVGGWEGGGCWAGCQQLILMDANDLAQPGTKPDQTDCLKHF